MKILFLDPIEKSDPTFGHLSAFRGLCQTHGIEFVTHAYEDWKTFPSIEAYAERFIQDIDDAAIVASTGSYFWAMFWANSLGVNAHLRKKIEEGLPFIFQSIRAWEKFFNEPHVIGGAEHVRNLFKTVGVHPTNLKVFTTDAASEVGGGAIGYFRSGDNCFLSADVFGDVDAIVLGSPNILTFDKGAYPAVETGPLHYLVDDGDFIAQGPDGLRPAVFVEVKDKTKRGFVIGGRFIGDAYDAVGGEVSGIETHEQAVAALIKKVVSWQTKPQTSESKLYQELYDLERGLGKILAARLPAHEAALLREKQLRDLLELAATYWQKIEDLFDYPDRTSFIRATSAIPKGSRHFIGHPIRFNYEPEAVSPQAEDQLRNAASAVRSALASLGSQSA